MRGCLIHPAHSVSLSVDLVRRVRAARLSLVLAGPLVFVADACSDGGRVKQLDGTIAALTAETTLPTISSVLGPGGQ